MCVCDDEDEDAGERVAMDAAVLERARRLDAKAGSGRVPESAWDIFAGRAGGSVAWPLYQRMQARYAAVANLEKGLAHMRRQRVSLRRIKCDPLTIG